VRRRVRLAGRDENERRADRVPGIHEPQQAAVDRDTTAGIFGQTAEEQAGHDAKRHVLHRKEREHRHEHELRGRRRPGADLEVDSRGERVGGHEDDEREEPGLAGGVGKRTERDGDRQERAAEEERGKAAAIAETGAIWPWSDGPGDEGRDAQSRRTSPRARGSPPRCGASSPQDNRPAGRGHVG